MGSDVGQIFPTASLHRDHSILYALVCEKTFWRMTVFLKVELLSVRKKFYVEFSAIEVGLQLGLK